MTSDNLGSVKIWDLNSSNNPALLSADSALHSLAWTDDGDSLLLEHADGGTSTWNYLKGGPIIRSVSSGSGEHSAWSADRTRVAKYTDNDPAVVRIHKGKDVSVHAVCRLESEGEICQMAWSDDGSSLAIAQQSEKRVSVTTWDVDSENRRSKWSYVGPVGAGNDVSIYPLKLVWSPDHQHFAVGSLGEEGDNGTQIWQGHIYVVDAQSGACVRKHNVGGGRQRADIKAMAWRPGGRAIVAGTELGLIEAISVDSGTTIFSHPLNSTSLRSLSWNLRGDRIAAAADDGSVKILDANSGTDLLTFALEGKSHHVSWSPNGKRLAAATPTGQIQVWDATCAYAWEENKDRRGELARSYAVAIAGETAVEREARLQKVLALAPDTLDTWMLRGFTRATLGDFEGAAAEYSKIVSHNRNHSVSAAYSYGIALLGSGQVDAFREHCSAMLNDIKGSAKSPSIKRSFIKLTMSVPQVDIDPEIPIQIARDFVKNYGASNASAKLVLGTCLYRGGKFQEAAELLADAAEQLERQGNPAERPDLANALCVLAMTRHQLGHPFQANRILDQSFDIAQKLPTNISWSIAVPLQVLQREARALIQNGPIGGENQSGEARK